MKTFLKALIMFIFFAISSGVNYVTHWFITAEVDIFLWHPIARFLFATGEIALAIFWFAVFLESVDD